MTDSNTFTELLILLQPNFDGTLLSFICKVTDCVESCFHKMCLLCFFLLQNTLYYDTWWVGQHVCLTWLSTFLMLVTHFLSPRYLDLLHRSALHLGRWQRVEGRHVHVPYSA